MGNLRSKYINEEWDALESDTSFKIGDKVEIVNYGHLLWSNKKEIESQGGVPKGWNLLNDDGVVLTIDVAPELVGQTGIIVKGDDTYAVEGISGKHAWYNRKQLKLIGRLEDEQE